MANCNTAQNEVGGKDLLLKVCFEQAAATVDESESITSTAHGLKVADVVKFRDVGALTVIDADTFYYVVTVVNANSYKISATIGGTPIEMDATEASLTVDAFKTMGGLRSKSFGFSAEMIDITNGDSDQWKKALDGAGIRSFKVSGSGVPVNEAVFKAVRDRAMANLLTCMMFIDVKNSTIFEGCFKITSLEVSGDYDSEGNYSMDAESSGALTVQEAA